MTGDVLVARRVLRDLEAVAAAVAVVVAVRAVDALGAVTAAVVVRARGRLRPEQGVREGLLCPTTTKIAKPFWIS